MSVAKKLLSAGSTDDKLYVDDVFSTYLYTGNGSTQTINNGIDLAGEGGMVWLKSRLSANHHRILDTNRGAGNFLSSSTTGSNNASAPFTSFNANGFTLGDGGDINNSTDAYTSWTFRKAPKFFDVVTYTGDDTTRQIPHNLGVTPGMIIVKTTDTAGYDWQVWHRSTGTSNLALNTTNAAIFSGITSATSSTFTVQPLGGLNAPVGRQYVAYLYAHDTEEDGMIQCGSFYEGTTTTIGWEPQWIMIKRTNSSGDWMIIDNMRGCAVGGMDAVLYPNLSDVEQSASNDWIDFTATGFISKSLLGSFIYMAIRRPNKPPTSGSEVYNAIARTGTGSTPWVASGAGFAPDMAIMSGRNLSGFSYAQGHQHSVIDRVRNATEHIQTVNTSSEGGSWGAGHILNMNGYDGKYSSDWGYFNASGGTYVDFFFKRAPGFFDVVCYTGTGVNGATFSHSLSAIPELIIVKKRNDTSTWQVFNGPQSSQGSVKTLVLNGIGGTVNDTTSNFSSKFYNTLPTTTTFTLGNSTDVNHGSGTHTYIAYLFASLPGISKVGSYTGNGSSQTINCGFTTGARFILIKRTDSTGDWYVWDTARGIVAANDPHLSLNTTAAEVTTDDSVDPESSGFIVNQNTATDINVNGGSYIFLAIA